MAEANVTGSGRIKYASRDKDYFEKRGLSRYAGVWSLWALGVGAASPGWGRSKRSIS